MDNQSFIPLNSLIDIQANANPGNGGNGPILLPVFETKGSDGQQIFTASIIGPISNLVEYTLLIQVLDRATPGQVVRLILDTQGGQVDTAVAIANAIRRSKATVIGIANGQVMSSASTFIFPACHKFEIRRGAIFMFHSSTHNQSGKSMVIRDYAITIIDYLKQCLQMVVDLGLLEPSELEQIIEKKATIFLPGEIVKSRMLLKGHTVS